MTEINKAGVTGSLGHIDTSQGEFRDQIDALTDAVRQLGGNATIAPGSTVINDPMSAPYILYVNSYTGSDRFVAGDYASADDGTFAAKMRRISNQRLECGYTEARPFKTINRAVIEAAIITSRDYLNLGRMCGDNITIVVMSGTHEAINGQGKADIDENFSTWADSYDPTVEDLQSFNPEAVSGIVLPRSVSIISADLRKTRISPYYVPPPDDEAADLRNRGAIFRMTGGGYYYGFSFVDKIVKEGMPQTSHHLLSCFEFASVEQLDEFYSKIRKCFSSVAGINDAFAVTRNYENRIVGPAPDPGTQTEATDTTEGSSPYIYNCSIRSNYGLCGVLLDGSKASGFKSTVIAQFTGVSLQRDMSCWQAYNSGDWKNYSQDDYDSYIDESPDNVRMNPDRRSFHIRCTNRAIIQEVSVFAIGQGVHHWVQSGGELTVTNSNSNFGGVSALAEGFIEKSFATDTNWNVATINVMRDMTVLRNKFQSLQIEELEDSVPNTSLTLTLKESLEGKEDNKPEVINVKGFSLDNYGGVSYIWLNNPNGTDYYAPLADNAWTVAEPNVIRIAAPFRSADRDTPPTTDPSSPFPPIAGLSLYVRRLQDTRGLDDRTYSITCKNTSPNSRNIVRDYGIQTDVLGAAINREIDVHEPIVAQEIKVLPADESGVYRVNKIELRRASASELWDANGEYLLGYHKENNYYRPGDVCLYQNKHFKCIKEHIAVLPFDVSKWDECFVHMRTEYPAEDFFKNTRPVLIFDKDKDKTKDDPLLGYRNSDFENDDELRRQYRTSTDYLGLYSFLRSLGFNDEDTHTLLLPKPPEERERDPNRALDSIQPPYEAANAWDNWPIQMRRPSNIRLFGQAMEWTGYLNYTKALPQYQRDLSASNKFSYYFSNEYGGRVYLSAFNEEGFQITAAGLTDLATGETLSPENLGSDDIDPNVVIFNGDVFVNGVLEANQIESAQKSRVFTLGNNRDEPSEGRGMSWIAPAKAIPGVSDIDAITFDAQNQNGQIQGITRLGPFGYSGAHFLTPAWIDLWKAKNNLLGQTTGTKRIYVNPIAVAPTGDNPNPALNESYNYNANITDLLSRPPTEPNAAVTSLALAIQFANLAFATTTTINYYLGPGIYKRDLTTLTFEHPVVLYPYDYKTNDYLTNGAGGGSVPFMGTSNRGRGPGNSGLNQLQGVTLENHFKDPENHPIFLTSTRHFLYYNNLRLGFSFSPTQMVFKKRGQMQGLVWWGATTCLEQLQGTRVSSPELVDNSIFANSSGLTPGQLQKVTLEPRETILNAFMYMATQNNIDVPNVSAISTKPAFVAYSDLYIRDVAISATAIPFYNYGASSDQPLFEARENGVLSLNGLYLIGNNTFDSTGFEGQEDTDITPTFINQSNFKHFGFAPSLLSTDPGSANSTTTFQFCGWGSSINLGPGSRCYNTTYFNWHLMTRDFNYMADVDTIWNGDPTEDDEKQGPAFAQAIGRLCRNRRVISGHFVDYQARSSAVKSGFAGQFGRYQRGYGTTTTGWRVMGCSILTNTAASIEAASSGDPNGSIPAGTGWNYEPNGYLMRRNGTGGASPSNFAVTEPGILKTTHDYGSGNVRLNLKYAVVKTGLDWKRNYSGSRILYG